MRNIMLAAQIVLALSCTQLAAQATQPLSRTVFKLSPQHFTHNTLKMGVERFNNTHSSSFALFVAGRLDNNEESLYDREGYDGLAGELQLRKYIRPMKEHTSKKGNVYNRGVYGAAYVQGGAYSGEFAEQYAVYDPVTGMYTYNTRFNYKESIGNWGLGFSIGYQQTLWQVVFLEAFIGGGIQFSDRIQSGTPPENSYYYYAGITDPGYKGILPKIGLNIGLGL